ncbi:MAG: hypothetical protein AMQ74_01618 [Candidatus Methanofastidiosum methylothiophilum]|uniref:Uncharacterized protein n=1 Tax=Candidatus Methanofastidiosum methylothiophilum TaxID=1705564 RepID=A0A150ITK2_9EURY|nr:MAG: hypothetical protein AMQ74_01618 [Candidatus Methanofastidiosum methylthiophilus]
MLYEVRFTVEDIVFEIEAENKKEAEKKANEELKRMKIEDMSTGGIEIEELEED